MRPLLSSVTRFALTTTSAPALRAAALIAHGARRQLPVPPPASGTQPQVVVGGILVAKVAGPKEDFVQPFHSDNGTKLLLWIKMPAGQGLIEINEGASVITRFADDKGTDLGGRFGSFPEEFRDGS